MNFWLTRERRGIAFLLFLSIQKLQTFRSIVKRTLSPGAFTGSGFQRRGREDRRRRAPGDGTRESSPRNEGEGAKRSSEATAPTRKAGSTYPSESRCSRDQTSSKKYGLKHWIFSSYVFGSRYQHAA